MNVLQMPSVAAPDPRDQAAPGGRRFAVGLTDGVLTLSPSTCQPRGVNIRDVRYRKTGT